MSNPSGMATPSKRFDQQLDDFAQRLIKALDERQKGVHAILRPDRLESPSIG